MSYDLNVLSINQEKASNLTFTSSIELRNEIDFPDSQRYHTIWPFMSSSNGIWYSLGKDDDGWFSAMSIVDACFNEQLEREYIPYWVLDDEVISNLKPLMVYDEYKNEFESIIKFLIQQSPNRSIMFLARYQGGEKEIVYGVLEYVEFVKLLNDSKILFNICYIIRE